MFRRERAGNLEESSACPFDADPSLLLTDIERDSYLGHFYRSKLSRKIPIFPEKQDLVFQISSQTKWKSWKNNSVQTHAQLNFPKIRMFWHTSGSQVFV